MCREPVIIPVGSDRGDVIVGYEAHIISRQPGGPRAQPISPRDYDDYSNLILLCGKHHRLIDDAPHLFPEQTIRSIKAKHEEWVRFTLGRGRTSKPQRARRRSLWELSRTWTLRLLSLATAIALVWAILGRQQQGSSPEPISASTTCANADIVTNPTGGVMIFGGEGFTQAGTRAPCDRARVWNGGDWHVMNTAETPPGRWYPHMAYNAGQRQVLLFGGLAIDGTTRFTDTWTWDGLDWHRRAPALIPDGDVIAMADDPALGSIILLTGDYSSPPHTGTLKTWSWNGNEWRLMTTSGAPAEDEYSVQGSMVFDQKSRQLVAVFGTTHRCRWQRAVSDREHFADAGQPPCVAEGPNDVDYGYIRVHLPTTWTFDGHQWRAVPQADYPPIPVSAATSADGEALVEAGNGDTWGWEGGDHWSRWGHLPLTVAHIALNAQTGEVVAFGPSIGGGLNTWTWLGRSWHRVQGTPAPSIYLPPSPSPSLADQAAPPTAPTKFPVVYVRDPHDGRSLLALDWNGRSVGSVALPTPMSPAQADHEVSFPSVLQSPTGTGLVVAQTLLDSRGNVIARLLSTPVWQDDGQAVCDITGPNGSDPLPGLPVELIRVSLGGEVRHISTLPAMASPLYAVPLACSSSQDLAIAYETANQQGTVYVLRMSTGELLAHYQTPKGPVFSSPDGRFLVFGEAGGGLAIHDASSATVVGNLPIKASDAPSVYFSADDSLVAISHASWDVEVIHWPDRRAVWSLSGRSLWMVSVPGTDGLVLGADTGPGMEEVWRINSDGRAVKLATGLPIQY